jgi:uncharacterized protein
MNKLIKAITDHSYWVIAACVAIIVLVGTGTSQLKLVNSYKIFFNEDNKQLLAFEALENIYTKTDVLMITVEPKGGQIFTAKVLASLEQITEDAWQLPYAQRVDSLTNYQHTQVEDDDLYIDNLVLDAGDMDAEAAKALEDIAVNKPFLINRLINPSASVTAVVVTFKMPKADKSTALPSVITAAREFKQSILEQYPDYRVELSGNIVMNYAFTEASLTDLSTIVPITFLIIFVGIYVFVRSFSGVVASIIVIVGAITFAMGAIGYLGFALSPPVGNAPIMILTIAVADCLHILSAFNHKRRESGGKQEAIVYSLMINLKPVFLTSITTAVGFLTLNFSDAPPFRDLGNTVAIGVMAAFAFSILLLPALMMVMPIKDKRGQSTEAKLMERFADWVISKRKILFPVSGFAILFFIAFLPKNELNDIWSEYFDTRLDARVAGDYIRKNLTGLNTIQYSLDSGEASGINEPAYLNKVEQFANWYREQPEVLHVNVYTDIIKELNQNMNFGDPAFYAIPEERQQAAQFLLLYEMSLPQGIDLNNQINVDKSSTRLIVTLHNVSTVQILAIEDRANAWLRENAPAAMQQTGSSSDIMFAHLGQTNIKSMLLGTSIALVVISIILVFALKSLRYGIISLIPNIAPAAVGFGIWGMIDGQIGLGISVVAGMTLGIVVDDTVHFLSRYLYAKNQLNMNGKEAVRYSFHTVGVALTATSIILVAGFSILAFSTFLLNAQMGLLTAITIAVALIIDFLFLPTLLMRVDKKKDLSNTNEKTIEAGA